MFLFRSISRNFSISSQFAQEIAKLKKSELFLKQNEILRKAAFLLRGKNQKAEDSAALIKVLNKHFDLSKEHIFDTVLEAMIRVWHSPASNHILSILKDGNPFFKAWHARFGSSFENNGIRVFNPRILPEFGIKSPKPYIQLMHCAAVTNRDFEKVDQIFNLYTKVGLPDQGVYAKYLSLISSEFKLAIRVIKPKLKSVIKNFKIQIPISEWTPKTVTSVMKSNLNISDFNSALSLYLELRPEQKKLELYVFMITYLVRFKYLADAEMIVKDLINSKLELSLMARISLLDYYSRARKITEYKDLEREMSEKHYIGPKDWPRIWAIQIRAISLWDAVDLEHGGKKILNLLKDIEKKNGFYDQFFLSTAVECLIFLGYREKAYEFMEVADSNGVKVDLHTIHAALVGYLNAGYGHPEEVFDLMKKFSVIPSTTTMNYILQIYAKSNSPKMRSFYEEMRKKSHEVYYITKMDCINSSVEQNDLNSFQCFEKLKSSPVKSQDFGILAKAYHHFDKPQSMRIFWNEIASMKIPTDAYEYIFQCFMKHGDKSIENTSEKKYIDLIPSVWAGYYSQGSRSTTMCEIMMKYLLDYRSDPVACMALFEESITFPIPPSPQHMNFMLQSSILSIESKWRIFEGLKALHYPTVEDYALMMQAETDLEKLVELWEDFQSSDHVINERVVEAIKPLTDQNNSLKELVELQLKISQSS